MNWYEHHFFCYKLILHLHVTFSLGTWSKHRFLISLPEAINVISWNKSIFCRCTWYHTYESYSRLYFFFMAVFENWRKCCKSLLSILSKYCRQVNILSRNLTFQEVAFPNIIWYSSFNHESFPWQAKKLDCEHKIFLFVL